MSTFDEALTAAATLPREDQRLLIRELTERFSPEDRWTLVRGLVAVEPIEEWPAVLSGRSSDEVAGLLVQMLLSFEPAAQPAVLLRILEALAPEVQQAWIQLMYTEGRRRRQEAR